MTACKTCHPAAGRHAATAGAEAAAANSIGAISRTRKSRGSLARRPRVHDVPRANWRIRRDRATSPHRPRTARAVTTARARSRRPSRARAATRSRPGTNSSTSRGRRRGSRTAVRTRSWSPTSRARRATRSPRTATRPRPATPRARTPRATPTPTISARASRRRAARAHLATEPWRHLRADRPSPDATEFGATLDHAKHPGDCTHCHARATGSKELQMPAGHAACAGVACHSQAPRARAARRRGSTTATACHRVRPRRRTCRAPRRRSVVGARGVLAHGASRRRRARRVTTICVARMW